MKKSIVIFLLICLVGIPFFLSTQAVRADDDVEVTITLDQEELAADVSPGGDNTVTFTGNVSCEIPLNCPIQKVIFALEADIDYFYYPTIVPSEVEFDRNSTCHEFSVTLRVPKGTSHVSTTLLTITGTGEARPDNEDTRINVSPDTAHIGAEQFYAFEVRCDEPAAQCSAGVSRSFELEIENLGNDQDTVKIALEEESAKELKNASIEISLSQTEYIVDEGSFVFCNVEVKTGGNPKKTKTYDIKIKCYSYQAKSLGEDYEEETITLQLKVKPRSDSSPGFEILGLVLGIMLLLVMVKLRIG